jgi:hypothetical protein
MELKTIRVESVQVGHYLAVHPNKIENCKVGDIIAEHDSYNFGCGFKNTATVVFEDKESVVVRVIERYYSDAELQSEEFKLVQIIR